MRCFDANPPLNADAVFATDITTGALRRLDSSSSSSSSSRSSRAARSSTGEWRSASVSVQASTVQQLKITTPDDWHLHVRDGDSMRSVVPHTAAHFARAIIMPNLVPPVTTTDLVRFACVPWVVCWLWC